MAKRESKTDRWVLTAMVAVSLLVLVTGGRLARPVSNLVRFLLIPGADAGSYIAINLRDRLATGGTAELSERNGAVLAALARGELDGISNADLRAVGTIADAQMAAYARDWKARALRAEKVNRDLANFTGTFGPASRLSVELIPARVVADDPLPYGQSRTVNVGSRQGAKDGLPVTTRLVVFNRGKAVESAKPVSVVSEQAIVGRLQRTGSFSAQVTLVTDSSFRCEAQINRILKPGDDPRIVRVDRNGELTRERLTEGNNRPITKLIAEGNGRDKVIVNGVSAEHEVRVGDELVAQLEGVNLAQPLLIGTVVDVIDDPELGAAFDQLTVAPAVDLLSVRDVLLIRPILTAEGTR